MNALESHYGHEEVKKRAEEIAVEEGLQAKEVRSLSEDLKLTIWAKGYKEKYGAVIFLRGELAFYKDGSSDAQRQYDERLRAYFRLIEKK